ncbi:MAG TPA: hypothetical protein V6C84_07855 [Coleofasciculaceae cyanobacterium]|jgi:hypothetical protein
MNKDAEAINNFLAWLLQEPDPAITAPSGEISSQMTGSDQSGAVGLQTPYIDPLDSEEVDDMLSDLIESGSLPFEEVSLSKPGENPAVQDRFYSLLKHRLRAEIEQKPPRFPWETETCDYDSERSDQSLGDTVPDRVPQFWAAQLQSLSLPVPMPDSLLAQLFDQCQSVVQTSLREGEKLIQAVKELFPGQSDALNQLAGLVLASPYRGGVAQPQTGFPSHYDQATPAQQMALSLLAARTILEATTLRLSAKQPLIDRTWQTAAGLLVLSAEYLLQENRIRVQAQMPCSGSLSFRSDLAEAIAQTDHAGQLDVSLTHLEDQTYSLKVWLETDRPPLEFAICLVTEKA